MLIFNFGQVFTIAFICVIVGLCIGVSLNSKPKGEQVNHPAHYKKNGKECIEVMEEQFGPKAVYWFCILNNFKYKWRAGFKDDNSTEQDLAKAKWYKEYAEKICAKYPKEFIVKRYG